MQLAALFHEALLVDDGPTIVRFPKGSLPPELPVWASLADGVDIMHYSDAEKGSDNVELDKSVLVIAVGSMVETAVIAAQAHENVTVVDPGWVSPVAESLYSLASDHDAVLTVEDGITTPVRHLGFPAVFPLHASRNELLSEVGLDVAGISAAISELRRG